MTVQSTFSVAAHYSPKSTSFAGRGMVGGTLLANDSSLVFNNEQGGRIASIPFKDIKKIWFMYNRYGDYLRIQKKDRKGCFFRLEADGDIYERTDHYKALDQILNRNGLNTRNSLKWSLNLQEIAVVFLVLFMIVLDILAFVSIKAGEIQDGGALILFLLLGTIASVAFLVWIFRIRQKHKL